MMRLARIDQPDRRQGRKVAFVTLAGALVAALVLMISGYLPQVAQAQAVTSDSVWAWGRDNLAATAIPTPVQVSNLSDITEVDGGSQHDLALKDDGTVLAWGDNLQGQLGNNNAPTDSSSPVQVSNLSDVIDVAAGDFYSLALKSDGTVWAWGDNAEGQLGNDTQPTDSPIPVQVSNLSGVTEISSGGRHALALKSDGTVWAWGSSSSGQLGIGFSGPRDTPVQVSNLSDVTEVGGGGAHSLAVKDDGSLWAWGSNSGGQLGDGSTSPRSLPVQVSNLSGATEVAGGGEHSLALKSDGTVWAWGGDTSGQLGNNDPLENSPSPVQVSDLSGVTDVAAGENHNLALKSDGTAWAWGRDSSGQLGNDASLTNSPIPVQVSGLSKIVEVQAGSSHSLALQDITPPTLDTDKSDGTDSVSPDNGQRGVRRISNVTATFSEPMDPSTLNDTTVTLLNTKTGVLVSPISLAVSSDGRTLTLNPFGPTTQKLAKRTTYKVTIKGGSGGATDVAGNPLNQPGPNAIDAEWTFKTGRK